MQKQNILERALIFWMLSFGIFVYWSCYVVTSQAGIINESSQPSTYKVSCIEN
jgi:hypothetical protein